MTPDELVRMIAAGETLADMSALIRFGEPLIFMSDSHKNARVHFFARRVHFRAAAGTVTLGQQQAKGAKLEAAIEGDLKGGRYGG